MIAGFRPIRPSEMPTAKDRRQQGLILPCQGFLGTVCILGASGYRIFTAQRLGFALSLLLGSLEVYRAQRVGLDFEFLQAPVSRVWVVEILF